MPGKSPLPRSFSPSATTARQRRVIELLANGKKAREIAHELGGITENGARKLMARALAAQARRLLSEEAFEQAAATYLGWHERLFEAWMPYAVGYVDGQTMKPDKDGADVVLKLMKQYADVYGLNAPIRVQPVAADDPGAVRPEADIVTAVMTHLDELSERMGLIGGPPPVVIEGESTPTESPSVTG
jgi:DNA-binding CsgD family transcriptional regulator